MEASASHVGTADMARRGEGRTHARVDEPSDPARARTRARGVGDLRRPRTR